MRARGDRYLPPPAVVSFLGRFDGVIAGSKLGEPQGRGTLLQHAVQRDGHALGNADQAQSARGLDGVSLQVIAIAQRREQ